MKRCIGTTIYTKDLPEDQKPPEDPLDVMANLAWLKKMHKAEREKLNSNIIHEESKGSTHRSKGESDK